MALIAGRQTPRAAPTRLPGPANAVLIAAAAALLAFHIALYARTWAQGGTVFGSHDLVLHDFAVFWGAGRLAASGHAAAAYDWVRLQALIEAALGKPDSEWVRTFFYPPSFLLAMAPLGLLPFRAAAAIWLGTTLAAYLAGMRAIAAGGTAMLLALAAPVVLFNFNVGQNGLLTAALLAGALALLDRRPAASGVLIGLLTYKPQFGLLLPLFLALTGRWRVFAGAALTFAGLVAISAGLFGWQIWIAFAEALPAGVHNLQNVRLTHVMGWGDVESVYGVLRAAGVGNAGAWVGHALVAFAAAAASLRIAVGDAPEPIKAAALATAAVVVTPYSEPYDVTILMVPWFFLYRDGVARGFRWWEMPVLAAVFLMPMLYLVAWSAARALGCDLRSPAGMAPAMCLLLAAAIGLRLWRPARPAAAG